MRICCCVGEFSTPLWPVDRSLGDIEGEELLKMSARFGGECASPFTPQVSLRQSNFRICVSADVKNRRMAGRCLVGRWKICLDHGCSEKKLQRDEGASQFGWVSWGNPLRLEELRNDDRGWGRDVYRGVAKFLCIADGGWYFARQFYNHEATFSGFKGEVGTCSLMQLKILYLLWGWSFWTCVYYYYQSFFFTFSYFQIMYHTQKIVKVY